MRFLKTKSAAAAPTAKEKPPVLAGWTEAELVEVYNVAPIRRLMKGEPVFAGVESTDSFFLLLEGTLEVVVKWEGHAGRPGLIWRGDCIAPLPKAGGLLYFGEAIEPTTTIEITPTVLNHLPPKTQLGVYKAAVAATSRINAYIRSVNGELAAKNTRLAEYAETRQAEHQRLTHSGRLETFVSNIPRLPSYLSDLAAKLLEETPCVQEVVEALKRDASAAALVLRTVNSAQYGLANKVESFYHACIILGFQNIYGILVHDAMAAAVPAGESSRRLHTHACLISTLCHEIALHSQDVRAQMAATIGLLHETGAGVQLLMKHAHWMPDEYVDALDAATLGAELLRMWRLPERMCRIVCDQRRPEFTPPYLIAEDIRRELGVLHVAHALEMLMTSGELSPELTIYTKDYMAGLGIAVATPEALLKERILPALCRSLQRLPQDLRSIVIAASERLAAA